LEALVLASVVIRAKNEARFIGEVLGAIQRQQGADPFEVIVVDSGSTDATLDIVKGFDVRLIEIAPESFTYGRALNIGIEAASGEFIASLSAHSTPAHDGWLAGLIEPFNNGRVAGVVGRQIPRSNATWLELLGMRMSGVMSERRELRHRSPRFSNANSGLRRTLWQRVPFDESVAGAEDFAWARTMLALGYLVAYEPKAAVYHSHGEPPLKQLRRAMRDGPTVLGNVLGLGDARGQSPPTSRVVAPEK
jgi:rhamnosyltransferase